MRCDACPVRPGLECLGLVHPPMCGYVAEGRPGRAEQLIALAEGRPLPPDPGRADARLAMLADLCPMGHGCGCGSVARLCSHPDRPAEVYRPVCLRCAAVAAWEASSETPS